MSYHETQTEEPTIHVDRTVANIFGSREDDVDQLCHISDLAANVRYELQRNDIKAALMDLELTEADFHKHFLEWEWK